MGISRNGLQRLTQKPAKANSMPHGLNKKCGVPGKKRFYSFVRGHTLISLRQAKATLFFKTQSF
jgi:hypothetical protein